MAKKKKKAIENELKEIKLENIHVKVPPSCPGFVVTLPDKACLPPAVPFPTRVDAGQGAEYRIYFPSSTPLMRTGGCE
jgi:hypothetical protein